MSKQYRSKLGHLLLAQTTQNKPVLTLEAYCKWYEMHLLHPDGTVTEVDSEVVLEAAHGLWIDHNYHPKALLLVAKYLDVYYCELSLELAAGRCVLEGAFGCGDYPLGGYFLEEEDESTDSEAEVLGMSPEVDKVSLGGPRPTTVEFRVLRTGTFDPVVRFADGVRISIPQCVSVSRNNRDGVMVVSSYLNSRHSNISRIVHNPEEFCRYYKEVCSYVKTVDGRLRVGDRDVNHLEFTQEVKCQ